MSYADRGALGQEQDAVVAGIGHAAVVQARVPGTSTSCRWTATPRSLPLVIFTPPGRVDLCSADRADLADGSLGSDVGRAGNDLDGLVRCRRSIWQITRWSESGCVVNRQDLAGDNVVRSLRRGSPRSSTLEPDMVILASNSLGVTPINICIIFQPGKRQFHLDEHSLFRNENRSDGNMQIHLPHGLKAIPHDGSAALCGILHADFVAFTVIHVLPQNRAS